MQNLVRAARVSSLVLIAFAVTAIPQSPARHQISNVRETAINIEKVNKRPGSRVETAIKEYETLLKTSPNDATVLNNLAVNYFLAGRIFEAQSLLRKAAKRSPQLTQVRVNLAIALNRSYNPGLAIETLQEVLKEEPGDLRAREILCEIFGQEKMNSDAISCYEVLDESGNLNAVEAANYGTALIESNELGRALSVLRRANTKFPDDAGINNGIGVALYLSKKYAMAETHLRRAVELEPDAPQLRYNLAMAQMVINKRGAVLEQYKYLKTSDPELASKLYKFLFRDKIVTVKPQ